MTRPLPLRPAVAAAFGLAAIVSGAVHAQVAVRGGTCDLPVRAPQTSAHRDLGPDDPAVQTCTVGWWCFATGTGAAATPLRHASYSPRRRAADADEALRAIRSGERDKVIEGLKVLADQVDEFLARASESAVDFWGARWWKTNGYDAWVLDPPPGATEKVTFGECYTTAELEAAKREALRWARQMRDVYFARHFGPDRSTWPRWVPGSTRGGP